MFARELTPFQEKILVVLEEYKRSPRKLASIFTAYAEGVIKAPPPAQAALIPGAEITKEGLWESAVKAPEAQPVLMEEVIRMFDETCERPSGNYQYLSEFFTESAPEALLFATETGGIERKIDTVLAQLESGIAEIQESSKFKAFIDTMSKFHDYSLGNIILITLQKPGAARVAGYRTWQDLGRNVKKGEHGIMILAPCFPPRPKKEEEDEEEIERELAPIYFKVVHVFDIGQTEGKELPRVEVPVITGEETGPLFQNALTYVAKQGITLDSRPRPDLEPDLMGFWSKPNNLIWVRPDVPQDQRTKTLLHETAHALCAMRGARDAEVMAESVAYTVANHFGYDTGVRSFPYVALWARDVKLLKNNLEIIRKVAKDMIEGIEQVAELSEVARMFERGDDIMAGCYADSCKEISLMLKEQPWGAESMLAWAERLKVQADRADGCRNLQEAAYTKAYEVIKIAQPMIKSAKAKEANLEQSTLSAIGSAAITGIGIGAGFKFIDWLAKKFTEKGTELGAPMKLLTKEIRDKLPPLYSQEKVEDPMVQVKFFTPDSNWTWYGIEFDGEDRFFGWVVGFEKELGYFSLSELESARGPLGLPIERDMWFKPQPLSEVKKLHLEERGELGNEKSSAGFPLNPKEEQPGDINHFYQWTNKASGDEVLRELCERADYLGAHLCLVKEGDDVDKEWIEKCPYIGTEDVYSELGRLRFLCWKLTGKLPSSVMIFRKEAPVAEMANTEHFCLSGDAWFELQDAISKGEEQKAMEIMWSKGMKLVLAPMTEQPSPYARQLPAYVDVFATTIAKHYRPTEDFHEGSIRVTKPEPDILVYLGCLKGDSWDAEAQRCSPNLTVLKTLVPNTKKYRDDLDHLKLVHPEVKVNYQAKEAGVEPVVSEGEQEELAAVDKALEHAEEVS